MDTWTILLSVIAVLIGIYYACGRNNYLEKHGIIHTNGLPFLGHMAPVLFRRITFLDFVKNIYSIHKDAKYVGFYNFSTPTIVIRNPELIKIIAIKNFDNFVDHQSFVNPEQDPLFANNLSALCGQRWREMRSLLSPAFTTNKMKAMFKLITEYGESFANHLANETAEKPVMYDSQDIFTRCTVDIIATCAFGIEINSMKNPDNDFYILGKKATETAGIIALTKILLLTLFPGLAKMLRLHILDKKVEKFFISLVKSNIEKREREGIYRPDMIQLMMESRKHGEGRGATLSIQDMTAQAFVFFFGGFSTTSTSLCFIIHHIADDPDVQKKLQGEVDEVHRKFNGTLTYEAVNSMPYLDALVNECLRLHPIGIILDRVCTREFELPPALSGKRPVLLKPDSKIWIPAYALHMDPQYFHDPEKFNPERFMEDPQGRLHSTAYYPFGIGPRMCIGNRFALLEIKVLIFHLVLKCSIKIGEKMIMPMRIDKKTAFLPEGGFWISLEHRIHQSNIQ